MNRIKGIIYDWVLLLATAGFRKKAVGKKMLVIRVDEIGDFLLWHKFLNEITQCEKFRDYECHFCGNQSWQQLFQQFDAESVSASFWLDKTRFKKKMGYRYAFLRSLYKQNYTTVINPTYSRDKRNDDSIVRAAKAKNRFGMSANDECVRSYEIGYDRKLYTSLFVHNEKPLFEFTRNRLFTEWLTGSSSNISNTTLEVNDLPLPDQSLPEKFFVVFPGSRSKHRIWPAESFLQVSQHLFDSHGWTAVVCGTKADQIYTNEFCSEYVHPYIDLTGKTSLLQMLRLLAAAQCLLSVDTGSVHLAVAAGCPVFGIFNGSQYLRFAPYPGDMAPGFHAIYPDEIEKELSDRDLVMKKYEKVVKVPYSLVRPEKVIHETYIYFNRYPV